MVARRLIVTAAGVWCFALGWSISAREVTLLQAATSQPAPAATQPPAAAPANADCLACHEDDSAVRADGRPVVVKPAPFEASIHGSLSCVDCHADLASMTELPHPEKLARVDCSTCHTDAVEKFNQSAHAQARGKGSADAATCASCHGMHDIRPSSDPQSRTYHLNIAATCSACHGNPELSARAGMPADVASAFADSIHGRALSNAGLTVAPTCSNCHGAHDVLPSGDSRSRVAATNVPATCGTCHEGIALKFNAGVHGTMLAGGNSGAPACQTCHTAHSIRRSESTAWQLSVVGQCGTCHADRLATFRDTLHGQVTNLGFRAVAACADCHGAHEILPSSDPRSPIAPANLVATCGKCHENANANFVKYDPHADKHDRARSPVLYYVSQFMVVLLTVTFSFFGIHTALWFAKELRVRRAAGRAFPPSGPRPVNEPERKEGADGHHG
jgi:hypothetical protein